MWEEVPNKNCRTNVWSSPQQTGVVWMDKMSSYVKVIYSGGRRVEATKLGMLKSIVCSETTDNSVISSDYHSFNQFSIVSPIIIHLFGPCVTHLS